MKQMIAAMLLLITTSALAQTEKFCIAKDGKTATIIVDENDNNRYSYFGNRGSNGMYLHE